MIGPDAYTGLVNASSGMETFANSAATGLPYPQLYMQGVDCVAKDISLAAPAHIGLEGPISSYRGDTRHNNMAVDDLQPSTPSELSAVPYLDWLFPLLPSPSSDMSFLDSPESRNLYKQNPRFVGDLYTAPWVRGTGSDRAGWCTFCSSWLKLKDSAYWVTHELFLYCKHTKPLLTNEQYHIHYTHGISCATGRQFPRPEAMRLSSKTKDWETLCGHCCQWISVGCGITRSRTAYFRHAYKCRAQQRTKSTYIRKSPAKLARPTLHAGD